MSQSVAFVAVAREKSFTRAAAHLGLSQSAVSHAVRALETKLGARLLARNSRTVSPTEVGERLLQSVAPQLEEIDAEMSALSALRDSPMGTIRITASDHAIRSVLAARLKKFLPKYPGIQVELFADNGLVDLAAERFDAGVRLGEIVAQDMIALRIGPDIRFAVVATKGYFARHPLPGTPDDLMQHNCINLRFPTYGGLWAWEFEKAGRQINVRVNGQLTYWRASAWRTYRKTSRSPTSAPATWYPCWKTGAPTGRDTISTIPAGGNRRGPCPC